MCFSATASFVTAGALVATGAVCLKYAKKPERLLALVPLLFGLQQAIEGVQWLSPHPSLLSTALGYAYLCFAFLLWPTYIPLTVYFLETQKKRRLIIKWLLTAGLFMSCSLLIALFIYPLKIDIHDGNFIYSLAASTPLFIGGAVIYSTAVVGSLLVSSRKPLPLFGLLILATEIVAATFFPAGYVSVWCFFAAASSLCIGFCFYLWSRKQS